MKNKRHEKILQLISENAIDTQEGLQQILREYGFEVTQATVSRDIKELRLVKMMSATGKYRYAVAQDAVAQGGSVSERSVRFTAIFTESVNTIDFAENIVVIKCRTGMANAACAALDTMEYPGIVGTIAGDDTIFVLMRSREMAGTLVDDLNKLVSK